MCINSNKVNIFHKCKKTPMDYVKTQCTLLKYKVSERRLGTLPSDWLKNLKKDEFSHATETVDKLFNAYAKECYKTVEFTELNDKLAKDLGQVLKRNDIQVKYNDYGHFKECQKITVGNYDYAFLTFFENFDNIREPVHGKYVEPQMIYYAYKNFSHGRVAKPFMSRIAANREESAYLLNKYIDIKDKNRKKVPLNPLRTRYSKLICRDSIRNGNTINGVLCDVGGTKLNERYISDKNFRENLGRFLDRIWADYIGIQRHNVEALAKYSVSKNEYNSIMKAEKFLSELMDNEINIFSVDLRKYSKDLLPDEQKTAIRMVRRMRNVHNFKNELKAKGEYEKYRRILNEYTYYCPNTLIKELELIPAK